MKYILILIFIISCTPMFVNDKNLNAIWVGKDYTEIYDIIGPYNKKIEDLTKSGNSILIWEASKENILIPIEKIGSKKNKLGTSISSLHVYVDENNKIINIKKSLY